MLQSMDSQRVGHDLAREQFCLESLGILVKVNFFLYSLNNLSLFLILVCIDPSFLGSPLSLHVFDDPFIWD